MVPDTVKMPAPEVFNGEYDRETMCAFVNACKMFFKLTGVSDVNTQALFTKTRLAHTGMTRRVMMRIRSILLSCMLICWRILCPQILRDGHEGIWWHSKWVVVLQLTILMTSAGALSVVGTCMKLKQNSFSKPIWQIG